MLVFQLNEFCKPKKLVRLRRTGLVKSISTTFMAHSA